MFDTSKLNVGDKVAVCHTSNLNCGFIETTVEKIDKRGDIHVVGFTGLQYVFTARNGKERGKANSYSYLYLADLGTCVARKADYEAKKEYCDKVLSFLKTAEDTIRGHRCSTGAVVSRLTEEEKAALIAQIQAL